MGVDAPSLLYQFGPEDVIICDASENALRAGSTSPDALEALVGRGIRVLSRENLHAKIYLVGKTAFVGSANATKAAAGKLLEAVVVTSNSGVVQASRELIDNIKGTVEVNEAYVRWAKRVYWPPRPPVGREKAGGGSPTGRLTLQVATFEDYQPPESAKELVRRRRQRSRSKAGPTAQYAVNWTWGSYSWLHPGDWLVWVDPSGDPRQAWPPAECFDEEAVGGRSRQVVSWVREFTDLSPMPWEEVKGRVLGSTGKRIPLDKGVKDPAVIRAVFDVWGIKLPEDDSGNP